MLNGKKTNGEVVTINLTKWQVGIGIILAILLTVNAAFTLTENVLGGNHSPLTPELQAAMQEVVTVYEKTNALEHTNIMSAHDKDIIGLKTEISGINKDIDHINLKLDQILQLLMEHNP